MKKGIVGILIGVFLAAALLLLGAFNLTKPRILVLHSSERDSSSAMKLDEGIRRVLDKNRQPLSARWHYLGINRLPDEDHREDAAKIGRRAIEQFDPDVLIAVDDEAQQYVARRYAGQARPKIVFAGIDHDPAEYGYTNAANVTGISETLPLAAVRDTLLTARQGRPARIAVLSKPGPTGSGQLRQVQDFNWAPHSVVAVHSLADFAAWQRAVTANAEKADVLLVLSYKGLSAEPKSVKTVPVTEVASWIEAHAKALPVGISAAYVEQGGGLAVAPSPREMGEAATQRALSWIRSGAAAPEPVSSGSHYRIAIRDSALKARGVSLPSIYVEAARLDRLYFP
jgi:hypothetical protein